MTEQDLDHVDRIAAQWARERPELDVWPMQVIGRLHRLGARLNDELGTVFAGFGVSDGEFDVLCALRRSGSPYRLSSGEIARSTLVTAGTVTKRVDRLERAGLVDREVSGDDARSRLVGLTEVGLSLIDRAYEAHLANEHRLVAALTPEDQAALVTLLRAWDGGLEAGG